MGKREKEILPIKSEAPICPAMSRNGVSFHGSLSRFSTSHSYKAIIQGLQNLNADIASFTKQIHLKTLLGLLFAVKLMQIGSLL